MATSVSASLPGPQGPAKVLALEGDRPADLLAAVRHGLPFTALEAIASHLDLPSAEIGVLLGIPQRTFARRRKTLLLSPQESDRLYRLARTVSMAAEVLGSQTKARQWLCSPNRALAAEEPLRLLDTDIGARQVEEVLLMLEQEELEYNQQNQEIQEHLDLVIPEEQDHLQLTMQQWVEEVEEQEQ